MSGLFRLQLATTHFVSALLWVGLMPDDPTRAMLDSAASAAAGPFQMLASRSKPDLGA